MSEQPQLPASPLAPLRPDPDFRSRKPGDTKTVLRRLLIPMVLASIVAVALGSLPLMLLGAVVWTGWLVYYVLITQVLLPTGDQTPSVNQHSNIEALEAKGRYAEAATAYREVIAADPADVVACEKLAQVALRQLRDYDTAIFAYREAERRTPEPKRQLGFAMLIAGIYRDNLKDYGRAMVELRRVVSQYPQAPNHARLSAEIDELKALHFEGK